MSPFWPSQMALGVNGQVPEDKRNHGLNMGHPRYQKIKKKCWYIKIKCYEERIRYAFMFKIKHGRSLP